MRKKILTKEEALLKKKKASFIKKIIISTLVLLLICYIWNDLYFLSILMWYGIFIIAYIIMIYLLIKSFKEDRKYSSQKRK